MTNLSPPLKPIITNISIGDNITVTWSKPSNNTIGIKYILTASGDTGIIYAPSTPALTSNITISTIGTFYFYVQATNSCGSAISTVSGPFVLIASATGGTITNISGYKVHTFKANGTFTINRGITSVDFLIVGAGGAGGDPANTGGINYKSGGGGGGGAVIDKTTIPISAGSYSVVIGLGSGGMAAGQNSSFNGYTASGGLPGKNLSTPNGGSSGNGYSGGIGYNSNNSNGAGGGGGGAGNVGGNADSVNFIGGDGGVGTFSDILGTRTYYGGGGGGGTCGGTTRSNGGLGGGGKGSLTTTPDAGTANTGGGGGGGGVNSSQVAFGGKSGGSGIVIIRYPI